MMLTLDTPLAEARLPTMTATLLRRLREGLHIETIRDLLWHLPLRYEDRGAIVPITMVSIGTPTTILGTIERIRSGRMMRKRLSLAEAIVRDATGEIEVVWFNQPWMAERFRIGDRVLLSGKPSRNRRGRPYLANPSSEILERGRALPKGAVRQRSADTEASSATPIPIYTETEGVSSRWLNFLVGAALERLSPIVDDLPSDVREREGVRDLAACIRAAHFPQSLRDADRAKRELLFRELFALECAVLLSRAQRERHRAIAVPFAAAPIKEFLTQLPYALTDAQRIATYEILRDLEKPRPMRRILIGDVGSGKTIVAAIAAYHTIRAAKGQVALMAPTEILAKQHFGTLVKILTPFSIRIGLLTGSERRVTPKRVSSERAIPISKPKLYREVAEGEIDLLVGTHALISPPSRARPNRLRPQTALRFRKLLLGIIDEQHRFGVKQRQRMEDAERSFGGRSDCSPHLLSLTATPIPRTLALTVFGDLDVSRLSELPTGRQPVTTTILPPSREDIAFAKIRDEVAAGHQAFIICPLVSASEKIEAKAAEDEFERLRRHIFPNLRLGLVHGQLKSAEKESVMRAFAKGEIDVLVATPVVEVGIDIPNATVIVIEGAERFGLAQLYQFRGRVGRSHYPSFCFLISAAKGTPARERLRTIAQAQSGSDIAAADLNLRGPGELLGEQQSGIPDTMMRALADVELIERSRNAAKEFLRNAGRTHAPLLARRVANIRAKLHLS